jgi:ribosomal protein S18 acetylase RimI-like enzyme
MTTRNRHPHTNGACDARVRACAAPPNAHAAPRTPFAHAAAQAKPAANSPRAPQPPRAPFGSNAAHAAPHAPHAPAPANARARPQPPTQTRVAPTAQRQAANAAPSRRPGYRLLPPATLAGGRQQIRVAVAGSPKVAGSVDIRPAGGGKAYISNLKVERDFRRQGLANQLMDAALQSARAQGLKAARLEAHPSDDGISPQALVSMYSRMGFRNVGRSSRGNPLMERRL